MTKKDIESTANMERIQKIAEEICTWRKFSKNLILVLGAGSFGHPVAKRYKLHKDVPVKSHIGFSKTTENVRRLSTIVSTELHNLDIPTLPLQPSCFFLLRRGRICKADVSFIMHALGRGLLPILWGDVVMDMEHTYGILSGDQIMSYFYEKLPSDRMLFGTNVDGILTSGKEDEKYVISRLRDSDFSNIIEMAKGSKYVDVSGGMKGKLLEIWRTQKRPLEALIFNASVNGNVYKALAGEKIGTSINLKEEGIPHED
jgi:isopentenyl phosphate kinase